MSHEPGARLCVFCRRRTADPKYRPFCSDRCQVQDLANWATGTYAVPVDPRETDPTSDPDLPSDL